MKLSLATAALAALLVAGAAFAADAPAAAISLPAKNGNVSFEHKTHKTVKCEGCHADAKGGKIEGLGKDKAHATCVECHKKEAKGPTKCTDCHKKA
jgi:predicted CXXCH cytochrome family protein